MGVVAAEVARMNAARKQLGKPTLLTARQRMAGGTLQRRPDRVPVKRLGMAQMSKRRLFR